MEKKMEEKSPDTSGATGTGGVCGDISGSLGFPSVAEMVEEAAAEIERQLGARPKEHVPWPSAQELHQWGDGSGGSTGVQAPQEPMNWPGIISG